MNPAARWAVPYGIADGLFLRAALGVDQWERSPPGLSRTFGLQMGDWTIIVGVVVMTVGSRRESDPGPGRSPAYSWWESW